MKTVKITKTYQVISPESAEIGDFEDQGFDYQDQEMTLREVLSEVERGGFTEWSSSGGFHNGIWLSTIDPDRDMQSGNETYYSLHFSANSERVQKRIFNLIQKAGQ